MNCILIGTMDDMEHARSLEQLDFIGDFFFFLKKKKDFLFFYEGAMSINFSITFVPQTYMNTLNGILNL